MEEKTQADKDRSKMIEIVNKLHDGSSYNIYSALEEYGEHIKKETNNG